jgi:hypothetical protein
MKDYHINIFYSEEDGGYIADIPDLKACSAFGETPAEALAQNVFLKGVLPSRKLTFGASYLPGTAFLALKPASGKVFCRCR